MRFATRIQFIKNGQLIFEDDWSSVPRIGDTLGLVTFSGQFVEGLVTKVRWVGANLVEVHFKPEA